MGVIKYIWNNIFMRFFNYLPTTYQLCEKLLLFVILQVMLFSVLCMPHLKISEHIVPQGFFTIIKQKFCTIEIFVDHSIWTKSIAYTLLALTEYKGKLPFITLWLYAIVFVRNWWTNICNCIQFFQKNNYGENIANARPLAFILLTYFLLQAIFTIALYVRNVLIATRDSGDFSYNVNIYENPFLLEHHHHSRNIDGHGNVTIGDSNQENNGVEVDDQLLLDAFDGGEENEFFNGNGIAYDEFGDPNNDNEDEFLVVVGEQINPIFNLFSIGLNEHTIRETGGGDF